MELPDRQVRARTRPGRLAALDAWLVAREGELLRRTDGAWRDAVFLDVGFGDSPATTLEAALALRVLNPRLSVVGVDRDEGRVAAALTRSEADAGGDRAQPADVRVVRGGFGEREARGHPASVDVPFKRRGFAEREARGHAASVDVPLVRGGFGERDAVGHPASVDVRFVRGGFGELEALGPARVVRAVNVLRAYREDEVPAIHAALGAPLLDGGLVVEGSTDTDGHVSVVHLLRKADGRLVREALLFHTDFTRGFSPWLFRDFLPRDLRRRVREAEPIHAFLTAWAAAFEEARRELHGRRGTDRVRRADPPGSEALDSAQALVPPRLDLRALFAASVLRLAARVPGVDPDAWCLASGYLRWTAA